MQIGREFLIVCPMNVHSAQCINITLHMHACCFAPSNPTTKCSACAPAAIISKHQSSRHALMCPFNRPFNTAEVGMGHTTHSPVTVNQCPTLIVIILASWKNQQEHSMHAPQPPRHAPCCTCTSAHAQFKCSATQLMYLQHTCACLPPDSRRVTQPVPVCHVHPLPFHPF